MGDELAATRKPTTLWSPHHLLWQTLAVFIVWTYVWSLHADNDGLWFQGDAPRHAANGFFWFDYLCDFTPDARDYALRYYARYPVIDPASRPPVFYLLEGVAYHFLGPSPFVAKGLVLCFALAATLYLMAWLRTWVSPEAAWAAGLLLVLPGIVRWSHAIMLNVPALALGLAALYHARQWLEAPVGRRRDFALATFLTIMGILTYYLTAVVVVIIVTWIALRGRGKRWTIGKAVAVIACCIVVLLPFGWLVVHWAPVQLAWSLPALSNTFELSTWTFYPSRMPQIVNVYLLLLAGIGTLTGWAEKRRRGEVTILISWVVVLYAFLSLLVAKDLRYALPALIPLLGLAAIGVQTTSEWLTRWTRDPAAACRWLTTIVCLLLLPCQAYLVSRHQVEAIRGYRELVSFLEQVAPDEPVFYDGRYDGVFTYYVRAGDSQFRRRVVLGHKLLYAFAMVPGWRQQDYVSSPQEVIALLQQRGGCRWLAIEESKEKYPLRPMQLLRDAVKSSAFELVGSFPIDGPAIERVDVYRFKRAINEVKEVELPFPALGPDVKYRVRPISRRGLP